MNTPIDTHNRAISYRMHNHSTAWKTIVDWFLTSEFTYRTTQEQVERPGIHF